MRNFNQNGVAILFAILLVSIVLTVGLTLFDITWRQLLLSSFGQESQFAFYAADSARNCIRHYDNLEDLELRPFGYFGLVNGSLEYVPNNSNLPFDCGNGIISAPGLTPMFDHFQNSNPIQMVFPVPDTN